MNRFRCLRVRFDPVGMTIHDGVRNFSLKLLRL
jgi:hypothetical protein